MLKNWLSILKKMCKTDQEAVIIYNRPRFLWPICNLIWNVLNLKCRWCSWPKQKLWYLIKHGVFLQLHHLGRVSRLLLVFAEVRFMIVPIFYVKTQFSAVTIINEKNRTIKLKETKGSKSFLLPISKKCTIVHFQSCRTNI